MLHTQACLSCDLREKEESPCQFKWQRARSDSPAVPCSQAGAGAQWSCMIGRVKQRAQCAALAETFVAVAMANGFGCNWSPRQGRACTPSESSPVGGSARLPGTPTSRQARHARHAIDSRRACVIVVWLRARCTWRAVFATRRRLGRGMPRPRRAALRLFQVCREPRVPLSIPLPGYIFQY